MEKPSYLTRIKILSLTVLIGILSPAMGNSPAWSLDHNKIRTAGSFLDSRSTLAALRNLNRLRCLAANSEFSSGVEVADLPSKNSQKGTITLKIETTDAVIYGYEGTKIPSYLVANFDRIFRIVANYFSLEKGKNKVVV